jgi:hypothetical protein
LTTDEGETHTQNIDVDAVMEIIRREMQKRREQGKYQAQRFFEFEDVTCPEEPDSDDHNPLLYFLLSQVNQPVTRFSVELDLNPSRLDNLPVIGLLWNTLRRHLHSLSIFYVAKVVHPMTTFNRHLATILNIVVRQGQQRDVELTKLKQRLAELEAKLARLEEDA